MGFLAFLGVCTGFVFLICVGIRWICIAIAMMIQAGINGWEEGKSRLLTNRKLPRKTTVEVYVPEKSIPLEITQRPNHNTSLDGTVIFPTQVETASQRNTDNATMKTVIFNHGKCDICGKEFMTLQDDPVSPLQEVEWSINNGPKTRKNFCSDCLSNFIACTSPTNKRQGEAEATDSARKFWRFFGKK